MTVRELIKELQCCRNQDAQVYLCVEMDVKIGNNQRCDFVNCSIDDVADNVIGEVKLYSYEED